MNRATLAALVLCGTAACRATPDYGRPLPEGSPALLPLDLDEPTPDFREDWYLRSDLIPVVERSIQWTRRKYAEQFFPIEGIEHERALASLERFHELLVESVSGEEFDERINAEFTVYKSAGWDARGGGVLFTGYCTPILPGSREPRRGYDHPLYALPPDLAKGPQGEILGQAVEGGFRPYPTREAIEASHMLEGRELELVWLRNPIDAYIAHVNGSAFVETPEGDLLRFGYAGKNGREYTSLGQELVREGELKRDEVSLPRIREWARKHPDRVQGFLDRNESYVFFTPIEGNPRGSLNVEVAGGRSLATDKSLFPRGAVVFVDTELPTATGDRSQTYRRFLLDQDTGGAIRTAGRADIYLGVGPEAEHLAGRTRAEGQLYYLFLNDAGLERWRLARSSYEP